MSYRQDIDGLRAIAIALVVVFHFDLLGIGGSGFIGVDVFFVISGFLITGIIFRDLNEGQFSYSHFLYRRVRRLYPALVATLAIYFVVGWVLFFPDELLELALETAFSLVYTVNIYFWRFLDYFGLRAGSAPLLHNWSLSLEEQYYLLYPAFCLIVFRYFPRRTLLAVAVAMLASFALGVFSTGWKPVAAFYLLPTRAWEFLIGGALALAVHSRTPRGRWLWACGPVGFALIVIAVIIFNPSIGVPGWYALLPTIGAALMITGGFATNAPITRVLSSAPATWLGRISYPLYLVHWPVLIVANSAVFETDLATRYVAVGVSIALSWAIYKFVEMPIRRGEVLEKPRHLVSAALAATLVLIGISASAVATNGWPSRISVQALAVLKSATPSLENRNCVGDPKGPHSCVLGPEGVEPSMVIAGDSHAAALSPALDIWLRQAGVAAVFTYQSNCIPLAGLNSLRCGNYGEAVEQFALENSNIEVVLLVASWRQAFGNRGIAIDGTFREPGEARTLTADRLKQLAESLHAAGKSLMMTDPLFAPPRNLPKTIARNLNFGSDWPIARPESEYRDTFGTLHAMADAAGIRRIDLNAPFCGNGLCIPLLGNQPIFHDTDHIAREVAPFFARILANEAKLAQVQ